MREMKDSHVVWMGKIPACWKVIPVKYVVNIGNGSDPKKEGLTPVYGSGNASFKTCGEHKEGPAVLLGRKGTVNIPQYIEGKYWNVDTAFDAKPVDDYNLKLFYYSAICFDYDNYSTQTALPSMTQSTYNNFRVPLPSIDEQNRIVNYLDSKCSEIDALSADIQKEIETLEQYKRSVITEAVTKGLNPDAEMKDSGIEWVESIPVHWDVRPLYYYFAERKKKNYLGQEQNLLSLSYGKVIRKDINTSEGLLPDSFNGYNIIEPGDIVLRLTDLQNDKRSLRTGLVKEHGIITSAYVTLKAAKEVVPEYFHYLLHAYDVMKVLYNMGNGVRQGLNYSELSKMHIVAPAIDEQKNIAAYLDAKCKEIESIIESKKQQLKVIDSYKKSLIYEYVTGKKEVPNEQ